MIHLQLPDGKTFKVERKGMLTFTQPPFQFSPQTFKIYYDLWLKNQVKQIK